MCCRNGRPPVYPDEVERITDNLPRLLPMMRPQAAAVVTRQGFLSKRRKAGAHTARVAGGWCVFFHRGCVLHQVGAAEGSAFRYKPSACALFPLQQNARGEWYVRQWGVENEPWDLFCLNPRHSATPAAESLRAEIALARSFDEAP